MRLLIHFLHCKMSHLVKCNVISDLVSVLQILYKSSDNGDGYGQVKGVGAEETWTVYLVPSRKITAASRTNRVRIINMQPSS